MLESWSLENVKLSVDPRALRALIRQGSASHVGKEFRMLTVCEQKRPRVRIRIVSQFRSLQTNDLWTESAVDAIRQIYHRPLKWNSPFVLDVIIIMVELRPIIDFCSDKNQGNRNLDLILSVVILWSLMNEATREYGI